MYEYKRELENALAEKNIVNRTRRDTHSEAAQELNVVKRKTAELESQIEYEGCKTANFEKRNISCRRR